MRSRFTCLSRHFLPLSWRVTLAGLAIAYAGCSLAANLRYAQGWHLQPPIVIDLTDLEAAGELFPLSHTMRSGAADAAIQVSGQLPAAVVLRLIDGALRGDPYAKDLLYDRALFAPAMATPR